ncbi:MAG TPA: lipase [Herpetosiphonaceae bacterium]
MRRRMGLALVCLMVCSMLLPGARAQAAPAARQNSNPIVLVHGLSGWGRDEVAGFKYWGGFTDLQEDLKAQGHQVHTAAVGPFSSNWDRAAELYAQIAGGTVDYGAAHSAKHGHARFGRAFPGFYREWGSLDPAGQPRKIHLVGHSQGGQTVRVLAQLLAEGDAAERAATPAAQLSPLFNATRKNWIHSVTTLATPHDGSALAIAINTLLPFLQQMVAFVAATAGAGNANLYDFKLDQWGLKRNAGESFDSYANRVWNSGLWTRTKDISAWDLSPDGAKELNSWVKAQPEIYYFSWSMEKTYEGWLSGHHYPEITMNPLFSGTSLFLGSYTRTQAGLVPITSAWWQNDGVVNTISMNGPKVGSTDRIVRLGSAPLRGAWNDMGVLASYDHIDIIGLSLYDVRGWYRTLANQLAALPQ